MRLTSDPTLDATAGYRRKARQLRARLARRPADLLLALNGLARQQDLRHRQLDLRADVRFALDEGFGRHVDDRLAKGAFRYSDRMDLLRAAERIGVDRFRANLIIAERQHRAVMDPTAASSPSRWKTAIAIQAGLIGLLAYFWGAV